MPEPLVHVAARDSGTVAQNVWFNLTSPAALAGYWTRTPTNQNSSPQFLVQLVLGQLTKCPDRSSTAPYRFVPLVQSTIFSKVWHWSCSLCSWKHMITADAFPAMCTKTTLYNYSIISLLSVHGSAQSSYKNKNCLEMLPSGFIILLRQLLIWRAFKFQDKILFQKL